jgi:hypothetical protein
MRIANEAINTPMTSDVRAFYLCENADNLEQEHKLFVTFYTVTCRSIARQRQREKQLYNRRYRVTTL